MTVSDVLAPAADVPASARNVPLNEPKHGALDQLRGGARLQREEVEKPFRIVPNSAERDLSGFVKRRRVEFVWTSTPGSNRLKKRWLSREPCRNLRKQRHLQDRLGERVGERPEGPFNRTVSPLLR